MAQLSDYLALVPAWNANKPKFMNTLAVLLQPLIDAQAMLAQLTADFDLDTAIGVQLDMLGQWIGRTRYIDVPVTGVFFSFDDGGGPRTGFDQGVWLGAYQPSDAITALDDDTYRSVLKLQAIANGWDGTIASIGPAMAAVFPGVVLDDLGDSTSGLMAMDVLIPGGEMSSLLLAVLTQDFPVKPAGVKVTIIETTVSTEPIFGFDVDYVEGGAIAGFDQSAWGIVLATL
jgi:hypothetical protein